MIGMREHTYLKVYKMVLDKEGVNRIIDLMLDIRSQEKKFDRINLPTEYYVVYSDCSDGDILDVNVSDAYYSELLPQFIFVDPYNKKDLWINIAHELIHDLQQLLYVFMDDTDVPYNERWQEIMAYKLEKEVKEIIIKYKKYNKTIKVGHENIEKFIAEKIDLKDMIDFFDNDINLKNIINI